MQILKILLTIAVGYLLGSIIFSVALSRLFLGKDVRSEGSGNAGATNMARVFGAKAGILTFLLDFFKCLIAIYIGRALLGELGILLAGVSCLLGHCFPVFFHFKGGKAVSSGAALAFVFGWKVFAVTLLVFLLLAFTTKKVSISSMTAAAVPILSTIFLPQSLPMVLLGAAGFLIIVVRHKENIRRLINGTEKDFHFGGKNKK